jgi:hypothetical protein
MEPTIVDEAIRKMLALQSVRIHCTSTREGEMEDDPGTMEFTVTIVGEDYYRQGDLDDSELVDHVRAILGEPKESIFYRGTEYVRDPRTSDWLTEDAGRRRRGYTVSETHVIATGIIDEQLAWSDDEARRLLLLFGGFLDPAARFEVAADEQSAGRDLVHLRAETSDVLPFSGLPSKDAFDDRIREGLPLELREQIEAMMLRIPDSFHYVNEFSIGRASKLIQRFEGIHDSLLDGRVVHRSHTIRTFSHFNEASLPGPLPE